MLFDFQGLICIRRDWAPRYSVGLTCFATYTVIKVGHTASCTVFRTPDMFCVAFHYYRIRNLVLDRAK